MIPYADFLYFGVLLYVVLPASIFALAGRAARLVIVVATLAMLAVQYGDRVPVAPSVEIRELWIVAGYALYQLAVAGAFVRVRSATAARAPFYAALLLALAPLAAAKFVPLLAPELRLGFLGISYVTFRALDVIFSTQDKLIGSLPAGRYLAYLFFFPTVSAGPIDRYRRFTADWQRRRTRAEFLADLDVAIDRVFRGFLYKFIVAALLKRHWLDPAESTEGFVGTLSYMYAYTFHLFFDFAGYSAFAIGVSYLFGIRTPENFDRPFLARNIRDFWNRWHITLSWWLRDHVYMRFVMAATKGRWFQSRYLASTLGLLLAFGLMGLWHGPAAHYLLYGLYHGLLLSGYESFTRWNKRRAIWGEGRLWNAAGILATFHCVCFGFLLFSGHLTARGESAAATSGLEGRLERATCEEISGWARDAGRPGTTLNVDLYSDEVKIATVRAELARPDLAMAGKGTGEHAFVFAPPPALRDGWPHSITARYSGTDVVLSGGAPPIVCAAAVKSMDGYEGAHESSDCDSIRGWALDTTRPGRVVEVDIYDGATLLATVVADQPRENPEEATRGGGRHGFRWPTSSRLKDGRPHSTSVRLSGSNVTLRDTPRILNCPPSSSAPVRDATAPTPTFTPQVAKTPTPGPPRAYSDNRDGTITDLGTGLVWEKKIKMDRQVDRANLNDADNCHPWAGTCATGGAECRVDADCKENGPCQAGDCQSAAPDGLTIFQWVERLNAAKYAGHDDWRLPTSSELYGIVDPFEGNDAATLQAFKGVSCGAACGDAGDPACSCNQPGLYWAAPTSAPQPDESWMSFFFCNGHLFLDLKNNRFFVRAVRGGHESPG